MNPVIPTDEGPGYDRKTLMEFTYIYCCEKSMMYGVQSVRAVVGHAEKHEQFSTV